MQFERGDPAKPKGHGLLYFSSTEVEGVLATYVVILPVRMDIGKYLPPMFSSQMGYLKEEEFSAFALPPVPEEVESTHYIRQLAETRDEDLMYGGDISLQDPNRAIEEVNEVVQEYARLYTNYAAEASSLEPESPSAQVNEVLYELMGEKEKLGELSKLITQIRFAAERDDRQLLQENEAAIRTLARYLPEWYRLDELLEAARDTSERGTKLAQLYLERCYKLAAEDYAALKETEQAIEKLKSS